MQTCILCSVAWSTRFIVEIQMSECTKLIGCCAVVFVVDRVVVQHTADSLGVDYPLSDHSMILILTDCLLTASEHCFSVGNQEY